MLTAASGNVAASTEDLLIEHFEAVCLQNPGDAENSINSATERGAIRMPNEFARKLFNFDEGEAVAATLGISKDWETYWVILSSTKVWKTDWLHCSLYHPFSRGNLVIEKMLPSFTQRAPFGLDDNEYRKVKTWTANNYSEQATINIVEFTSSDWPHGTSLVFNSVFSEGSNQ